MQTKEGYDHAQYYYNRNEQILKYLQVHISKTPHRPISLINYENKIITKVLNNQIAKILPVINYNQNDFIQKNK